MGKKSLLAPTSGENTGNGEGSEKEKTPVAAARSAKKPAPKPKKTPAAAAAKKKTAGSKTDKKKAAPKKSSPGIKSPSMAAVRAKSSAGAKAGKKNAGSVSGDAVDGAAVRPSTQASEKPEIKSFPGDAGPSGSEGPSISFSQTRSGGMVREEKRTLDPAKKMAAVGLAVLALLLIMVLWTSAANVGKFYAKPVDGRLEIWKGRFSPKGMDKIYTLTGASMPAQPKAVYSREEAHLLIFEGILADADALLGAQQMPDFEAIRRTLASAAPFAVSKEMAQRLQRRLDKIDMMALVYRADVLAGKGTREGLARARESLEKAMDLDLDEAEKGLIEQKINWVDQKLAETAEE